MHQQACAEEDRTVSDLDERMAKAQALRGKHEEQVSEARLELDHMIQEAREAGFVFTTQVPPKCVVGDKFNAVAPTGEVMQIVTPDPDDPFLARKGESGEALVVVRVPPAEGR